MVYWKPWMFLKAFRMAKYVTFPYFSGILVFKNFLKGPIQYLLVQSEQWKNQNNVPKMFQVSNKETRTTLITLMMLMIYCCDLMPDGVLQKICDKI